MTQKQTKAPKTANLTIRPQRIFSEEFKSQKWPNLQQEKHPSASFINAGKTVDALMKLDLPSGVDVEIKV
jgi:ribosomal protein S10